MDQVMLHMLKMADVTASRGLTLFDRLERPGFQYTEAWRDPTCFVPRQWLASRFSQQLQ